MTEDSQPDQTDELLGRMDALLGKHRPADAPADDDDIPVLTEVVIDMVEAGDEIPVLQDLAPEFDSAVAFAEPDDFDIPILEEALPDSLADVTAFAVDGAVPTEIDQAEIVLEMDSPAPRRPELILLEDAPTELVLELAEPEQELLLSGAAEILLPAAPPVAVCPAESADATVVVPAVTGEQVAAVVDEILADVATGLDARVAAIVRRHFAVTLAAMYRDSLQQALQAAMAEIRQDLRSTVEQVVADQLDRRDL